MYTVRKLFKFEMAHVLESAFSKECMHLHGHSYKLEVLISSETLNNDGMVIDFKELKEFIQSRILDQVDHAAFTPKSLAHLFANKFHFTVCGCNPTAENMAKDFYDTIKMELLGKLPGMYKLIIRLHETDTGYAEYSE